MKTLLLSVAGFALITLSAFGQATPAPASDDPMAGLNLSDTGGYQEDGAAAGWGVGAMELRGQGRSQMEFGNEEKRFRR